MVAASLSKSRVGRSGGRRSSETRARAGGSDERCIVEETSGGGSGKGLGGGEGRGKEREKGE